jgi:succinate dehydrogenase / fumarate reductase membrane anchor subunit
MSLQSPLGKFLGHGSAKDGTDHWWAQRVTAVALIPLTIWFVVSVLGMDVADYSTVRVWMASPLNAILLILLLATLLHHSQLGLQVVVEDYVHSHGLKVVTLMAFKFIHVGLGVAGAYSVIIISVGAS